MALNLATMTLQRPSIEHGALAAARLPRLNAGDSAGLQQQATALGFQAVGTDQYSHPDGSWVALNPARQNAVERGYQSLLFRGIPADLAQLPAIPVAQAGAAAATQVPTQIPNSDAAAFTATLLASGFVQALPSHFSHADGSWVAIINGNPVRGFGAAQLAGQVQARPAPARRPGRGARQPLAPATGLAADQSANLPQAQPTWSDGLLACAQLPFLQPQNLTSDRATFVQKGFQESSPGLFQHADGSWIAYASDGRIERGLANQRFQRVPPGPSRMGAQPPQASHLQLAVAQPEIAKLTAANLSKSDQVLLDAGFTKIRGAVYEHADRSFVALVDGQIHFGANQQLLSGPPTLANLQTLPVDLNVVVQSTQLWDLPTAAAAAKAELTKRGFAETRPGFFQAGQLWVAIEGRTVHCGNGTARYASIPSLTQLPRINPDVSHGWLAVVQTANLTADQPTLPQSLGGLGFRAIGPGFYQHADGSWLAVHQGQLLHGLGGNVFSTIPQAPPPGTYPVYAGPNPPGNGWAWYQQNTALGRTPVMRANDQATRTTIAGLGYARVGQGTAPERWQHPDGSWVELGGSVPVLVGFQQWQIGQLPFQR